jgi:acyl-CoA hydrolase
VSDEKSRMHELIGRAIADPDFRAALISDPDKAIKEAGYELTEDEIASLRQIDLKAAVEELGERTSKTIPCW